MVPRLLLLFAFFLISCKVFQVIHIEIFKKNLCDDNFYSGGIINSDSTQKSSVVLNVNKSKRPEKNRTAATHRYSKPAYKREVTYSSYEAYKKSGSNLR